MMADAAKHEPEELQAFRAEVAEWIHKNKPDKPAFKLPQSFLEVESEEQFDYLRDWQNKVYDAGYLGFDVPEEYGGRGVDRQRQRIVMQELIKSRAPFFVNFIGLNWAGPVILAYGTEEGPASAQPGAELRDQLEDVRIVGADAPQRLREPEHVLEVRAAGSL